MLKSPMLKNLTIEKLSHDGRGIARLDGKTLFVAGALPTETVGAKLVKSHKRFDEYQTIAVNSPAAQRSVPACSHYGSCGGCQLQHLSAQGQLEHKQVAALELIQRSSGLVPAQVLPAIQGESLGYRSRARLSAWYQNNEYRIGFREAASKNIINIDHCPTLHTQLDKLLPALPDLCTQLKLGTDLGHIDLQLHETNTDELQPALSLRVMSAFTDEQHAVLQTFAEQHGCLVNVQENKKGVTPAAHPQSMQYKLPEQKLAINFNWGDFTQANRLLNRQMVSRAVELLQLKDNDKVLDGFCGLGNFSLAIAQQAESVIGIEGSLDMTQHADNNATLNNINNVSFWQRNLMDADSLKTLSKKKFNKALIDPPRDGAKELCAMLCKHKVERLVYVSCDPANLARDAKILMEGKYQLESLYVNDMFPQSSHSEITACFTYASKKKQA